MQFGKWHGRPAREITRKMRVPQSNCISTDSQCKPNQRTVITNIRADFADLTDQESILFLRAFASHGGVREREE